MRTWKPSTMTFSFKKELFVTLHSFLALPKQLRSRLKEKKRPNVVDFPIMSAYDSISFTWLMGMHKLRRNACDNINSHAFLCRSEQIELTGEELVDCYYAHPGRHILFRYLLFSLERYLPDGFYSCPVYAFLFLHRKHEASHLFT